MSHALAFWSTALGLALVASTAHSAPNILSVVETGGDTDRPTAKYTGLTFDISNPTGTVLVPNYTVGTFGEDAKAMVDRTHEYNAASPTTPLPPYLVGREYVMSSNNNRDNASLRLDITVAQISQVYLLIDNRLGDGDAANPPSFAANMKWVVDQGWFPYSVAGNHLGNPTFPDTVGLDEGADGTINQYYSVYTKFVPSGTFSLYQADNGGRNMYGVVVAAIPEPGAVTLAGLGAALLFARRRRQS